MSSGVGSSFVVGAHPPPSGMGKLASGVMAVAAVTDPQDAVNLLLGKLDRNELGLAQAADLVEEVLFKGGYGYYMDIAPRQVGLDPANRDGEGGNAQQVLQLAGDIFDVGFSFEATRHATCCEIIPGDPKVEEFNRRFAEGNGVAGVSKDSIHFVCLTVAIRG